MRPSPQLRQIILRANAGFLTVMSLVGLAMDLAGAFLARGPQARILHPGATDGPPAVAIGFVEAHGLALILGLTLWRVPPTRPWHLTAAAIHILLGLSNLFFWGIFVETGMLGMGYFTTILHGVFMTIQLAAALSDRDGR